MGPATQTPEAEDLDDSLVVPGLEGFAVTGFRGFIGLEIIEVYRFSFSMALSFLP